MYTPNSNLINDTTGMLYPPGLKPNSQNQQANLSEVIQVLQHRGFPQINPMRYVIT